MYSIVIRLVLTCGILVNLVTKLLLVCILNNEEGIQLEEI